MGRPLLRSNKAASVRSTSAAVAWTPPTIAAKPVRSARGPGAVLRTPRRTARQQEEEDAREALSTSGRDVAHVLRDRVLPMASLVEPSKYGVDGRHDLDGSTGACLCGNQNLRRV